jgi:S1-C subfamily serine protease
MKKWILAVSAVLLAWNIGLSFILSTKLSTAANGSTIVENTVNGYTTSITDVVARHAPSLVTVSADDRNISGLIYAVDGSTIYIFTDASITSDATVTFDSGREADARLIGTDPDTSLTLLSVNADFEVSPFIAGDSSILKAGEYIVALGGRRSDTGTPMVSYGVTGGVQMRRMNSSTLWAASVLETDAVVSQDNIGGALLNLNGELEGMLVSRPTGGQPEMGYAASINEMKLVYSELLNNGEVSKGILGVTGRAVSRLATYEKSQRSIPLDTSSGILVESVMSDSPSAKIILPGDVILTMDGESVADSEDLRARLYSHRSGDTVSLSVLREGKTESLSVVLG